MVSELLAKACRDAGAHEEEEVQVTLLMSAREGVVFLILHVGLGTYLFLSFPGLWHCKLHHNLTGPGGVSRVIPIGIPPLHVRGETSHFEALPCLAPWLRRRPRMRGQGA